MRVSPPDAMMSKRCFDLNVNEMREAVQQLLRTGLTLD